MQLADSLEREGKFQSAALQYASVAEEFPRSSFYPPAVRRAALLYSISRFPPETTVPPTDGTSRIFLSDEEA